MGSGRRGRPDSPLAALRLEAGLTQRELATRAGVAYGTYRKLERGVDAVWNPTIRALVNLQAVLSDELMRELDFEEVCDASWTSFTFPADVGFDPAQEIRYPRPAGRSRL